MSARRARVIAAYATVKILDPLTGKLAVRGFLRDAVMPTEADPESVAALVRRGYAEWFDGDEPEVVAPKQRTAEDKAAEDAAARQLEDEASAAKPSEDATAGGEDEKAGEAKDENGDKPKPYASKEAWLAYAASQRGEGVSEEDATAALEGKSKNDLIAEFG